MRDLDEARFIAQAVLEECGITAPPIDVHAIAAYLRIEVRKFCFELPPKRRRPRTDRGTAGFYWPGGLWPVIAVNAHDTVTRRRFTIAHEIGHALDADGRAMMIDGYACFSPEEQLMNQFAAELLMPPAMVRDAWRRVAGDGSVPQTAFMAMCRLFQVSKQAMSVRLKELGLV